jgi:shikimate kinase
MGKTTIGTRLATLLGFQFFDLDDEIENFFSISTERLQEKFLTIYSCWEEASKALKDLLDRESTQDSVIALPPIGLMGPYWRLVKSRAERLSYSLMMQSIY